MIQSSNQVFILTNKTQPNSNQYLFMIRSEQRVYSLGNVYRHDAAGLMYAGIL